MNPTNQTEDISEKILNELALGFNAKVYAEARFDSMYFFATEAGFNPNIIQCHLIDINEICKMYRKNERDNVLRVLEQVYCKAMQNEESRLYTSRKSSERTFTLLNQIKIRNETYGTIPALADLEINAFEEFHQIKIIE